MCPYCHKGKFLKAPREAPQQTMQQTVIIQQAQPEIRPSKNYCLNCGTKLIKYAKYCETCGSEIE